MKNKYFLEAKVKKIDKNIKSALKKAGIVYPHHSLAFFKATYAKFEEANLNKVMLAESVKDDVKYLIGTQMNRDHLRQGNIMGSIIDAYVTKNNEIEIIFTFAKNVYSEDYKLALELMEEGKLTVSFELMVDEEHTEYIANGVRRLTKVEFDGVGLLFGIKPAYSNAFVLNTAMKIIEDAFKNEDKKLVYASAKDITKKWVRIGELIETALSDVEQKINKKTLKTKRKVLSNIKDLENEKQEGENNMDKKANDALLAKQKEIIIEEFGNEAVKDWSDDDYLNQNKIDALRESLKTNEDAKEGKEEVVEDAEEKKEEIAEEKVEEAEEKKEEATEEKAEERVIETETKVSEKVTYDDEKSDSERIERTVEEETKVDGKTTKKLKQTVDVTYTYAQVEEIKAEYEKKLEEKDKEIAFIKDNVKKVMEIRAELGDFVKELSDEQLFDETLIEIAKLKKENAELRASKKAETASEEKAEETTEEVAEELETGHEEAEETDEDSDTLVAEYLKMKHNK